MEKKLSVLKKIKEVLKSKKLNNNKGFSLIELLIVIAIMGVLAVIAFNMFGGVLTNSKKRADEQQARNLEKAILTYCVDSGDWLLSQMAANEDGSGDIEVLDQNSKVLIKALMGNFYNKNDGKAYGPILSLKDPSKDVDDPINESAYDPQWNTNSGGEYAGWKIEVYPSKQTVKVRPVTTEAEAIVVNGDAS